MNGAARRPRRQALYVEVFERLWLCADDQSRAKMLRHIAWSIGFETDPEVARKKSEGTYPRYLRPRLADLCRAVAAIDDPGEQASRVRSARRERRDARLREARRALDEVVAGAERRARNRAKAVKAKG